MLKFIAFPIVFTAMHNKGESVSEIYHVYIEKNTIQKGNKKSRESISRFLFRTFSALSFFQIHFNLRKWVPRQQQQQQQQHSRTLTNTDFPQRLEEKKEHNAKGVHKVQRQYKLLCVMMLHSFSDRLLFLISKCLSAFSALFLLCLGVFWRKERDGEDTTTDITVIIIGCYFDLQETPFVAFLPGMGYAIVYFILGCAIFRSIEKVSVLDDWSASSLYSSYKLVCSLLV